MLAMTSDFRRPETLGERPVVLVCRAGLDELRPQLGAAAAGLSALPVGRQPGKEIDPLLEGRVIVIGDDADLNAVALRLLRRELLGAVVLGFVAERATPFTELYSLPTGTDGLRVALLGEPDPAPLLRNDVGGVLVGQAHLLDVHGTAYIDEHRVLAGAARSLLVRPDPAKGLEVAVHRRRWFGFSRGGAVTAGRALQVGSQPPMRVIADGVRLPRPMERWTYYRHTEPMRLLRGAF